MVIRRLIPADALGYRALMLEAYDAHPGAFSSSAAERAALPLAWWERRVTDAPDAREAVWGGFSGHQLIGVAGLRLERREKLVHKATLFGMYVQPQFRQRGVGDRLARTVLEEARDRPELEVVQLTVSEGNAAARSLYERHGFEAFGLEPCAVRVGDGYVAKVHMWCRLDRR